MKKFISALMALAITSTATAQVVVPVNPVSVPNGHPDWPVAPADGDKGPAVGGRAYQRYRIAPATTVLLPLQQVSSLQSPPGEASDVT
ncbi:hypothetical protein, partial [Parvimonas micra]|uniref:hypothetical protein n=1 Tax=Parvimonas micra TaxID=33033 RepID=UPI002B48CE08